MGECSWDAGGRACGMLVGRSPSSYLALRTTGLCISGLWEPEIRVGRSRL